VKDGLAAIHSPVKRLIRQKQIGNGCAGSKQGTNAPGDPVGYEEIGSND
jgi:hypothetical protein